MSIDVYVNNSFSDRCKRWAIDTITGTGYYQTVLGSMELMKHMPAGDAFENRIIMTAFNTTIGVRIATLYRDYLIDITRTKSLTGKAIATAISQITMYTPIYGTVLYMKGFPQEVITDMLLPYAITTGILSIGFNSILEYARKRFGKGVYERLEEKIEP